MASACISQRDRFLGCLLGGAVGDALGAPVEFMRRSDILRRFGAGGITDYGSAYGGLGCITDDTQLTLFTGEALLPAQVRLYLKGITTYSGVTAHAYLRWLQTQGEQSSCDADFGTEEMGGCSDIRNYIAAGAPGTTRIAELREMKSLGDQAKNDSKGCGGVMRVAPVGLFSSCVSASGADTFDLGVEIAGLTHGHPTGKLSAGVFALVISRLADQASLPEGARRLKENSKLS